MQSLQLSLHLFISEFLRTHKIREQRLRNLQTVLDVTTPDLAIFSRLKDVFTNFRTKRKPRNKKAGFDGAAAVPALDQCSPDRQELLDFFASLVHDFESSTKRAASVQIVAHLCSAIRSVLFHNVFRVIGPESVHHQIIEVLTLDGKNLLIIMLLCTCFHYYYDILCVALLFIIRN